MARGHPTGRGYLYAVFAGYWPTSDGRLQLRVKMGSTRDADPVAACYQRYSTFAGAVDVWWLVPSADAYRDEWHRMHSAFQDQRIFADRELFAFGSREEFEAAIGVFTHLFTAETAAEEADKPPPIADLSAPLGLKRKQREVQLANGREERRRLRGEHEAEVQAATKRQRDDREQQQQELLATLIQDECEVGAGLRVVAEEFNARAQARGAKRGVKNAMDRGGFARRNVSVNGKSVPCYHGLAWS